MRIALLPMYALPEMAGVSEALWEAVRLGAQAEGVADLPDHLSPAPVDLPATISPDTIFSQMCGYPLKRFYGGQYALLGTPLYDLPGCAMSAEGVPTHCSFVVVARASSYETLDDLRGSRFAMNGRESNSGMNLPRRLFAPLAGGQPFFGETIVTGMHVLSMEAVARGAADAAAIDCVTFGFCAMYRPDRIAGLRILAETPSSPAIPFITAAGTPPETIAAFTRVLTAPEHRAGLAKALAGLRIAEIAPARPQAYDAIVAFEEDSSAMGYSVLA